jgi:hypothetical protein
MQKKHHKYLIIFILLAFSAAILTYFAYTPGGKTKHLYDAIPVSSSLIIEAAHTGPLWNKLTQETNYWKALSQIDKMKDLDNQVSKLDSLLIKIPDIKNEMTKNPMALVMLEGLDGFGFVLIAEIGNQLSFYQIEKSISETFGRRITLVGQNLGNYQSGLIVDETSKIQFNFVLTNGLLIGSYQKDLVEHSLKQLNTAVTLLQDSNFVQLRRTAGNKVDANIFLHYKRITNLVVNNSMDLNKPGMQQFTDHFGGWVNLDLNLKTDLIQMVGYSAADTDSDFLQLLHKQKPVPVTMYKLLPFSTKIFLHNGVIDYPDFNKQITNNESIVILSEQLQIDLNAEVLEQIDAETMIAFGDNPADPLFIAKIHDQNELSQTLSELRSRFSASEPNREFDDLTLSHIPVENLVPVLFGRQFTSLSKFYYVLVDNYLIVANNFYRLEEMLRLYKSGRTLGLNENFTEFKNNLSEDANITIYCNLRDGLKSLSGFLDSRLLFHLNRNVFVLKEFEAFALQFSGQNNYVYTNLFVKHNPSYKEESMLIWSRKLDDQLSGKPAIIRDPATGESYTIAFDVNDKLYFLSSTGEVLWKHKLDSEPLSEVYVIENQNNKFSFLLNTKGYIYCFDRFGNQKNAFPVKLRAQATNGITLTDQSRSGNGQIIVSCSDRYTYSFDIKGNASKGWEKPKSLDIVEKPVEYLPAADRNYLVISDIKNDIRITDLTGRIRITPKGIIRKPVHNDFYVNKTNAKGVLLSTDSRGRIIYVSANGQLNYTDFAEVGATHFFFYYDFKKNNSVDFLFIEGNKLHIYDRFKKLLYAYEFKSEIDQKPWYALLPDNKKLLVITDSKNNEMYLFDHDGKMIISSGLINQNPFNVGSLGTTDEMNLVTIKDSTLYNYLVY